MLSGDTLYGIAKSGGSAGAHAVRSDIAPRIQLDDNSSRMRTNGFGFSVAGYRIRPSPSSAAPGCPQLPGCAETNTSGRPVHVLDLGWTNYPQRVYRARAE